MADTEQPRRRLAPPPNYLARGMQLRLFVVVAACMGVLYLVTEGISPRPGKSDESSQAESAEIDSRLARLPGEEARSSVEDGVRIVDPYRGSLPAAEQGSDGLTLAIADGYSAFYNSLPVQDRLLMTKALKQARHHQPLDAKDLAAWQALLTKGDQFWDGYRAEATKSLAGDGNERTSDETAAWLQVLGDVGKEWLTDREALESLASSITTPDAARDVRLERLAQRWQQLALAAVQDDTVQRPDDSDAWFSLLEQLQNTPSAELAKQAAPEVGYVQLFKQPRDYRGQRVRIRGRVLQAKRVETRDNHYGIEHLYILWLQPMEGAKSPFVVYTLELPPGFPSLDHPNRPDGYVRLREDVEVTGYFFKRWAYLAGDGINTAPLLLAKVPQWFPAANVGSRATGLPAAWVLASWTLGAALFGIAVAVVVYRRTRAVSPILKNWEASPQRQQQTKDSLASVEAGPSVLESLRLLEERDRQADKESRS